MSNNQNNDFPPATLVGAKRVREVEADAKGRKQVVFTFGPDSKGNNGAIALANAINELASQGKQINLDFRIGEAEGKGGRTFSTAFLLVKEMVPKAAGTSSYTAKPSTADKLAKQAEKIRAEVEG